MVIDALKSDAGCRDNGVRMPSNVPGDRLEESIK